MILAGRLTPGGKLHKMMIDKLFQKTSKRFLTEHKLVNPGGPMRKRMAGAVLSVVLFLFGACGAANVWAELPASGSVVLWLKADAGVQKDANNKVSSWQDQSGKANNAVQSNAAFQPVFVPAAAGGKPAISFDGTASYLEAADSPTLNPSTQTITVAVWFKLSSDGVVNCSNLYGKENLYEASAGGGYCTYAMQPYWAWSGDTSFPVSVGQWYQAVVVYDGAKQYLYANGALVYSRAQTGDIGSDTNALRIGARGAPADASMFFPGLIDEFIIWNHALSADEVASLYKTGKASH